LTKILVTGGAGFIGSNFIRLLLHSRQAYSIINFDKLTYAGNLANLQDVISQNPRYEFVKGDICEPASVEPAMRACDVVVHFAAESHVDRSIYEPSPVVQTNITGTFVLLQLARKLGVSRFVHISTDEVYGDLPATNFASEEHGLRPSSPYAASKASADMLVLSYIRTYNLPAIITRSSNNYGPYQFPEKFLPLMITNALADKPLPIYGDGKQQRDWLHVEDNCRAILTVLERGRVGQIYNIGGCEIEENVTIAGRILELTGKPQSLLSHVQDRPGHDRRYALDCGKVRRELNWLPEISLQDGLRRTIDWYKANAEWVANVRRGEYLSYYEKWYENRDRSLKSVVAGTASQTLV
jgi:dTDP-glucose 4,6-dehydratase